VGPTDGRAPERGQNRFFFSLFGTFRLVLVFPSDTRNVGLTLGDNSRITKEWNPPLYISFRAQTTFCTSVFLDSSGPFSLLALRRLSAPHRRPPLPWCSSPSSVPRLVVTSSRRAVHRARLRLFLQEARRPLIIRKEYMMNKK
jgi:hypothetical protein